MDRETGNRSTLDKLHLKQTVQTIMHRIQGYTALSGKESGISRDVNKEYQNWLRMHYENQKNTRFLRFLLNQNLLTGKKN